MERGFLFLCGLVLWGTLSCSLRAGEIPWGSSDYVYQARDEKLPDVIRNFCSLQGINVVVSKSVGGRVSGRFDKIVPQVFLNQMCKAYSLVWYWDGKKLYVYTTDELKNGVIPMAPGLTSQLNQVLDHMGTSREWTTIKAIEEQGLTVLAGPPRFFELISDLSKQLENHQSQVTVQVFPLKNAWAYDLEFDFREEQMSVPGVATVLQAVVNDGQSTALFQNGKSVFASTAEKLKNKGMVPPQTTSQYGKAVDATAPTSNIVPPFPLANGLPFDNQSNIYPDVRLNAVVIRDTRENLAKYGELIKELDVPVAIVEIKAAIVDLNSDYTRVLGSDWLVRVKDGQSFLQAGVDNGRATTDDSNGNGSSNGVGLFGPGGPVQVAESLFPGTGGSITGLIVSNSVDFLGRIRALQEKGEAKLLSQPSVLTADNVQATLRNDQTYYVRVAGYQDVNLFNVTAGTTLQVTPHVIEDGGAKKIKLVLNIKDGNFTDVTVDQLPTVRESSVSTQATLLENQSLLVGGYTQEHDNVKTRGVPWLSEIPFVGYLFKREQKDNRKWERLFLISPRVVTLEYGKGEDVQKYFPEAKPLSPKTAPFVQPVTTPDIQDPLPTATVKKNTTSSKGSRQ